jgi:hypothetical protein
MHGGFACRNVSLYSPKFFVLPINVRMLSRTDCVRVGTASQVRFSRWIGAVLNVEMIEVSVEKLFNERHFYIEVSIGLASLRPLDHTSATEMKCFMTITRLLTSDCVKIISATQFVN